MLIDEARWIGERVTALHARDGFPLINVGSSTEAFRTRQQPWIDAQVFAPLRARGCGVLHVDRKDAPGVDVRGDLLDPALRATLRGLGARSVLCSNLLEHVEDRGPVTAAIAELVAPGGRAIVTVPRRYPTHHDPIDTGFRPDVEELAAEFPALRLVDGAIVTNTSTWPLIARNALSPTLWAWTLLRRRFQVTCVVLERRA